MASQASVPGVASGNLTCFNGGNACRVKPEPELFPTNYQIRHFVFPLFLPHFLGAPEREGFCSQSKRLHSGREPIQFREEPGKQRTRSCRAQELARSSAQENERQKKHSVSDSVAVWVEMRTEERQRQDE